MAISQAICSTFKQQLFQGVHNFNVVGGDTFFLALYTSAATIGAATTAYTSSGEVSSIGTNYPAEGGQLTSLADDDGSTVNPLDIQTGVATDSTRSVAGTVNTTLTQLLSPAQLPPVNKMSWLVVIEEIQPDP